MLCSLFLLLKGEPLRAGCVQLLWLDIYGSGEEAGFRLLAVSELLEKSFSTRGGSFKIPAEFGK